MDAAELKSFLTQSAGQPPADFESGLDDRTRYLHWWSAKIREHYGIVKFTPTPLDVSAPGLLEAYLGGGTLVVTMSYDAFEATFYFRRSDLNLTDLLVHSKVHGQAADYVEEWEMWGPAVE